jgi:hypothetical protein
MATNSNFRDNPLFDTQVSKRDFRYTFVNTELPFTPKGYDKKYQELYSEFVYMIRGYFEYSTFVRDGFFSRLRK